MITALTIMLKLCDFVSCLSYSKSQTRRNQCGIPKYLLYQRTKEFSMSRSSTQYLVFYVRAIWRKKFRFPVTEMGINSCHPICELPNANGCANKTHKLGRLIMREDELEFSSKATEAKKKYEKNIFVSIIRNIES